MPKEKRKEKGPKAQTKHTDPKFGFAFPLQKHTNATLDEVRLIKSDV